MTIEVKRVNNYLFINFDSQDELNEIKAVIKKHGASLERFTPSSLPGLMVQGNEEPTRGEIRIPQRAVSHEVDVIVSDIEKLAQEQLKTHEQTNRQTNNVEPSSGDAAQGAEGPPTPK